MEIDTLETFPTLRKVLEEYADAVIDDYRKKLDAQGKNASGKLSEGIQKEVRLRDGSIEVVLLLEDYFKYVEEGRKPGRRPPTDRILDWIRVKPVIPREDSKGRIPTEESLAYLIARKIGNEGIPAGHQLRDAVDEKTRTWIERLEEALKADWDTIHSVEIFNGVYESLKRFGCKH